MTPTRKVAWAAPAGCQTRQSHAVRYEMRVAAIKGADARSKQGQLALEQRALDGRPSTRQLSQRLASVFRFAADGAPGWETAIPDVIAEVAEVPRLTGRELDVLIEAASGSIRDLAASNAWDSLRRIAATMERFTAIADAGGRESVVRLVVGIRQAIYDGTHDVTSLLAAVDVLRRCLTYPDTSGDALWGMNVSLAEVLNMYHWATNDLAPLHAASDALQIAEGLPRPPLPGAHEVNLGDLRSRIEFHKYRAGLGGEHLDSGIAAYDDATEEHDADRAAEVAVRRASLLLSRTWRDGRIADLHRAIALLDAVDLAKAAQAARLQVRSLLGELLWQRYDHTGDKGDLARATALLEAAWSVVTDDADRAIIAIPLAQSLRALSQGRSPDLAQSLQAPDQGPSPDQLEQAARAIEILEAIFDRPGFSIEDTTNIGSNLLACLLWAGDSLGQTADAVRALEVARWLEARPERHSGRGRSDRREIASAYRIASKVTKDPGLAEEGWSRFEALAADVGAAPSSTVLETALEWGRWWSEHGVWERAASAFRVALDQFLTLVNVQITRGDKTSALRWAGNHLAAGGAYALLKVGDVAGAVGLIESVRAVLLENSLRDRSSDLARLRETGHVELAARLEGLLAELTSLESEELREETQRPPDGFVSRSDSTARALNTTVHAIRELPGFAEFWRTLTLSDVVSDADRDVYVYVGAAEDGGFAIAVGPHQRIRTVDLPEFTLPLVRAIRWIYGDEQRNHPDRWPSAYEMSLSHLWTVAVGPVTSALDRPDSVIVIPIGLVSLLPLHAAWHEDGGRREYASDFTLFRYVPSATIRRALDPIRAPACLRSGLVVADPSPTSAPRLRYAIKEIDSVKRAIPHAEVFRGPSARKLEILAAIGDVDLCHFACHGTRAERAIDSGLLLADDQVVSVRDLLAKRSARPGLAVLSACETALIDPDVPDEALGLPIALLGAGFSGVIATLFPVPDESTALLMDRFYRELMEDGTHPAAALADAQAQMRRTVGFLAHPMCWASFMYVGW